MPEKLSPPVAKCTRCGHLRRDVASIGGRCVRRPDGKRCEGFYLSVMSTTDWQRSVRRATPPDMKIPPVAVSAMAMAGFTLVARRDAAYERISSEAILLPSSVK